MTDEMHDVHILFDFSLELRSRHAGPGILLTLDAVSPDSGRSTWTLFLSRDEARTIASQLDMNADFLDRTRRQIDTAVNLASSNHQPPPPHTKLR